MTTTESHLHIGEMILTTILGFVISFFFCPHLSVHGHLSFSRQHHSRRRSHLVFDVDSDDCALPVFVYSSKAHPDPVDRSVFRRERNGWDTIKVQTQFIWFGSNSNCSLCRSLIEPVNGDESEMPFQVIVLISEPGRNESAFDPSLNASGDQVESEKERDFAGRSFLSRGRRNSFEVVLRINKRFGKVKNQLWHCSQTNSLRL